MSLKVLWKIAKAPHILNIDGIGDQTASLPVPPKSMLAGSYSPPGTGGEENNSCSYWD
jgi:hypothetical protein